MGKCVHPGIMTSGSAPTIRAIRSRLAKILTTVQSILRALDHDNRRPAAFLQLQDQRGRQVVELRRVGNSRMSFREFHRRSQRRGLSSGRSIEEARGMHPEDSKRAAR